MSSIRFSTVDPQYLLLRPTRFPIMSLMKTSVVQAELAELGELLSKLPHHQFPELVRALAAANTSMQKFLKTGTQTETFGPTFSTEGIVEDTAGRPLKLDNYYRDFKMQSLHVEVILHSIDIFNNTLIFCGRDPVFRAPDPASFGSSYPAREYLTSITSYTMRTPLACQYSHNSPPFGAQYDKFQCHRSVLKGLSNLVSSQTLVLTTRQDETERDRDASLTFLVNMESIIEKVCGWRKEMECVDVALGSTG
ncbi:MAG: hypothetical protein Q9168_003569 [Polycauliona sp. 1 TL-2023]